MPTTYFYKELDDLYKKGVETGLVDPDETRVDYMKRSYKSKKTTCQNAMWNILVNENSHLEKYDKNKKRLLAKLAKRKAARKN